ncbi:Serine/threonine-protein kinase pkn1 [Colletotrichum trifolii]|uniref:Serine/threonine-protein kinase pkn1 n=1 Tax=Colletotrichum trifolii TaxID=5466 RepID=A0A4R8RTJ8_COLTR|nr:Serine/threonine-protein kinase pkn1 [Colletotrichum trifolii]
MGNKVTKDSQELQPPPGSFGEEPLLVLPSGEIVDLANGYIPLLARFTFEDKASKGLRKRKPGQKPEPPVYFTALELVRDHKILYLTGASGSGKTTFAKYLSFRLVTSGFKKPRPVARNDLGDVKDEKWDIDGLIPYFFAVKDANDLRTLAKDSIPQLLRTEVQGKGNKVLIILDALERADQTAPEHISSIIESAKEHENVWVIFLGEATICGRWVLPSDLARHELLPLLATQKQQAVRRLLDDNDSREKVATGEAAANPALFALALQAKHPGDRAEQLLDDWLSFAYPESPEADKLAEEAYHKVLGEYATKESQAWHTSLILDPRTTSPALLSGIVQQLLAARHLSGLSATTAVNHFHRQPLTSTPVIRSCLLRLQEAGKSDELVEGLLGGTKTESQRGALLVADLVSDDPRFRTNIFEVVLSVVTNGSLSPREREQAGRILSRLGDPRDLTALADVPAGSFVMGSESHPNSRPTARISLNSFKIGIYPVVNRDYLVFARETGRDWLSPDAGDPERQSAPATDLTWYDARAYCNWLTKQWRRSGKISAAEQVRLPTEPEFERASRGDQDAAGSEGLAFPWGTEWQDDLANSEEVGFNKTCTVGLFPNGRSPYGCYDMAGQVWEWCTTLWGEDMATPSFKYPYSNDGREALNAPEPVRRVLRGGCFSSPKIKANCTYRGSLEPAGFWRGNGFRMVVAPIAS